MAATEVNLGVSKYNNDTGVNCYMNSIMAILQQTPYFVDYIISDNYKIDNIEYIENSIIFQLFKIFKISLSHDNANLTISTFRQKLAKKYFVWGELQQQDSQEFLTFLLNTVEDEIKEKILYLPGRNFSIDNDDSSIKSSINNIMAIKNWEKFTKNEFSIIKTLFTAQLQTITCCEYCKYKNSRFEIFQNIQLDINDKCNNIYDCFDLLTTNEVLDKDNMVYCQFCFAKNRASRSNKIWKTPKVLIINFKRFKYNDFGMITGKNNRFIDYPIQQLNLEKYINHTSPYKSKSIYNLFAVNTHHSMGSHNSLNFGHYTSTVKNRYDNEWYNFDDDNVSKATFNNIVNNNAYLLFYLREN
jgi:ubiquitin carboxyl-terminal hydrolase 8